MRRLAIAVALLMCFHASSWSQSTTVSAGPQTARRALMEMFFSKTPGTFIKHLPAATLAALQKSGAMANLQSYSMMAGQWQMQGNNLETFETGAVLLSTTDPKTDQTFEVIIENDSLRGDQDDIELSFRSYKDNQLQRTPYMPQMTFAMRMESGIWKLNEISVTVHLPLADPDFLKSFTEKMKPQSGVQVISASNSEITVPRPVAATTNDPAVIAAMRTILAAEVTYSNTYHAVGFTCTLSDLDGFGGAERNEHQAMLIHSGLASGKRYGYVFALSGCAGAPATSFHLTATPYGEGSPRPAFCADQSGMVRLATDGNPTTCEATGTPVQ
jgi:hypothetical protein